jgi:hypothetical protein
MTIRRDQTNRTESIATVVNSATGEVDLLYPEDNSIIFDKGTGTSWIDDQGYGVNYGEWMIVPTVDFKTQVKIWGAGGGAHGSTGGAAGGGGHTYGDVRFLKGVPYIVWVGEGGFYSYHSYNSNGGRYIYRSNTTFGGGGGGGHNGGGGGGMSGLFFQAAPTNGGPGHGYQAVATSFRSPGQSTALLIAGGGGGAGHHGTSNHGQGGGGGGEVANHGHAQAQSNQHAGGHRWDAGSAGQIAWQFQGGFGGSSSYTGGGGGGWYGGPGGTHHSSHHNGGGGGSGHILPNTTGERPNYWIKEQYPNIVVNAGTTTAPGVHQNHNPAAAGTSDVDYTNYVGYGAGNSTTYTPSTNRGNNGRVMIRFKGIGGE